MAGVSGRESEAAAPRRMWKKREKLIDGRMEPERREVNPRDGISRENTKIAYRPGYLDKFEVTGFKTQEQG